MKTVRIISVGKLKKSQAYLQEGLNEYTKRLKSQLDLIWVEVKDYAPSDTRNIEWIMEQEASEIQKYILPNAFIILLSEHGEQMSSEGLASFLFYEETHSQALNPPVGGRGPQANQPIIFIIGGAFGTSSKLLAESHRVVSFSKLTFTHPMVRLILAEQLYRSWMITQNRPYHK